MSVKWDSQAHPKSLAEIWSSNVLEARRARRSVRGGRRVRQLARFCYSAFTRGGCYINRYAHLALELARDRGLFFDVGQRHLICTTHGALYTADTGECASGACNRSGLEVLDVVEAKGTVYLSDPRYVVLCRESKAGG